MRRFLGIVLLVLGIPVLLAGAAVAVFVGTDDTVDVVNETIESESAALVVPSSVLTVADLTLVITAEVDGAETFVGAAHPVHVESYLDGVGQLRVGEITRSREMTLTEVPGENQDVTLPAAASLDWWQASAAGGGSQHIEVDLTEEPVSVVVAALEPAPPLTATVTGAVQIDGLFIVAVAVGVAGLVLLVLGLLMLRAARRRRRARAAADDPDDPQDPQDPQEPAEAADAAEEETSSARITPLVPPPPQDPGRNLRVIGLAIAVPAVVLGGCAGIPRTVDASSTALVAATDEQNDFFFATYTETNNGANSDQDPEALADIETGPLLEASRFGLEVEQAQGLEPTEPFTITPTAFAAPSFETYPLFYLASATKDSTGSAYYLLTRPTAREPWRAAAVVDVTDETPFDLAGTVGESPDVADAGTAETAAGALDLVREYAETGTAPEGLDAAAGGSLADLHRLGYTADADAEGIASLDRTCEIQEPVPGGWLATNSGVLSIAVATCTQDLRTAAGFWFTPDDDYGTISGGTDITATTVTGVVPFLAQVADDGSVVVHGGRLALTGTEATTR